LMKFFEKSSGKPGDQASLELSRSIDYSAIVSRTFKPLSPDLHIEASSSRFVKVIGVSLSGRVKVDYRRSANASGISQLLGKLSITHQAKIGMLMRMFWNPQTGIVTGFSQHESIDFTLGESLTIEFSDRECALHRLPGNQPLNAVKSRGEPSRTRTC